jgi:hypothetical protein
MGEKRNAYGLVVCTPEGDSVLTTVVLSSSAQLHIVSKRDEMIGWRNLNEEELYNFYSFSNVIRVMKSTRIKCSGHITCKEGKNSLYRVLVCKPDGKKPLGRPRHRWDNDIKMDCIEIFHLSLG